MSTGYGWEGLRQVCATQTLLGARHVPERLCGSGRLVYFGRYNKCSPLPLPFKNKNRLALKIRICQNITQWLYSNGMAAGHCLLHGWALFVRHWKTVKVYEYRCTKCWTQDQKLLNRAAIRSSADIMTWAILTSIFDLWPKMTWSVHYGYYLFTITLIHGWTASWFRV